MATRNFKIWYVSHVLFLSDGAALGLRPGWPNAHCVLPALESPRHPKPGLGSSLSEPRGEDAGRQQGTATGPGTLRWSSDTGPDGTRPPRGSTDNPRKSTSCLQLCPQRSPVSNVPGTRLSCSPCTRRQPGTSAEAAAPGAPPIAGTLARRPARRLQ